MLFNRDNHYCFGTLVFFPVDRRNTMGDRNITMSIRDDLVLALIIAVIIVAGIFG